MRRADWTHGNAVRLLENGEEFFPRVFHAIAQATEVVLVETFILCEDKVGIALAEALCASASRGATTVLTIDGFGSPDLSDAFIARLTDAGVRVRIFDPGPAVLGQQLNLLRRMHRKLLVVDNRVAFVGGINFSADHLMDFGPMAKQDYAVELSGPIVGRIRKFMVKTAGSEGPDISGDAFDMHDSAGGTAAVLFAARDDKDSPDGIEQIYRHAIRAASTRIWIANAYFFPGYRLFHELCKAARRGVSVKLVLQGMPDLKSVRFAATLLYGHLLRAGVEVHEYCPRPLHGKVAIIDEAWSTVGSSNLDPLSLALNMEANVFVESEAFNRQVATRLQAMSAQCLRIRPESLRLWSRWPLLGSFIVFHVLRWASRIGTWLPRRVQKFKTPRSAEST
ncbi:MULTISPECIES: cardiolipin synthase ClsB [Variovorax]|jgi:cardiolipin synthase|uniref:cardiolipin synthase ClsB n=1 Tax=Variovorax TaxID=34072 RepID=UPI0008B2BA6A|nr:cardiolipin synthase ClsB [Variovorax sp. OV084]SEU23194.1 cardiolipin synthase [Variovorax sp. OV084]